MQLPLLFQWKPNVGVGPTVMLAQGKYRIKSNHVDSDLRIALGSDLCILSDFEIVQDTPVRVSIVKAGTEPHLTIFAVKL